VRPTPGVELAEHLIAFLSTKIEKLTKVKIEKLTTLAAGRAAMTKNLAQLQAFT
jgi:hypothetical protein